MIHVARVNLVRGPCGKPLFPRLKNALWVKNNVRCVSHFSTSDKSVGGARFTPRRRQGKNYRSPKTFTPKHKLKGPRDPFELWNQDEKYFDIGNSKDGSLEEQFGPMAAGAMLEAMRERDRPKDIEEQIRMADYMTAEHGSTEDLVGERHGLSVDIPDPEERKKFVKDLDELIDEERIKAWELGEDDAGDVLTKEELENRIHVSDSGEMERENPLLPGKWATAVIKVDRVQKVLPAGTQVSYRVLTIGGNGQGVAGFGVGKAPEPADATILSARETQRNIYLVDRFMGSGLTTDLVGKHNSCKVMLRATPIGSGYRGNDLIVEICHLFGITDVQCKCFGNRNPFNVVRATFKAIMQHESMREIALKRGKRLVNLERARRLEI